MLNEKLNSIFECRKRKSLTRRKIMLDLSKDPWILNCAAGYHNAVAACRLKYSQSDLGRVDTAIDNHRYGNSRLNLWHPAVVRSTFMSLQMRSAVKCQSGSTGIFNHFCNINNLNGTFIPPEASFDRNRDLNCFDSRRYHALHFGKVAQQ